MANMHQLEECVDLPLKRSLCSINIKQASTHHLRIITKHFKKEKALASQKISLWQQ